MTKALTFNDIEKTLQKLTLDEFDRDAIQATIFRIDRQDFEKVVPILDAMSNPENAKLSSGPVLPFIGELTRPYHSFLYLMYSSKGVLPETREYVLECLKDAVADEKKTPL
jgi:hypothetical protein